MNIKLKENYGIKTSDVYNLVLYKTVTRVKKEDGTKYQEDDFIGYHSTIYTALRSYLKRRVNESDCKDIEELMKLHKDLMKEIKDIH